MKIRHQGYAFGQMDSYRFVSVLGQGGFGVVYKIQNQDGRFYACKVLEPKTLKEPDLFEEFQREIQIGLNLSHEHLVSFHKSVMIHGDSNNEDRIYPAIIMDFVDGFDLGAFKRKYEQLMDHGLPPKYAILILAKACSGLEMLHDHRIRHGDVKPENILLSKTGYPKITDYGISAFWNKQSKDNVLMGTYRYLAPEQFNRVLGESVPVDNRADIYSMGMVTLEMTAGLPPQLHDQPPVIMNYVLNCNRDLRQYVNESKLPNKLKRVLTSCLDENQAKRPNKIRYLQNVLLQTVYGKSKGITLEDVGDVLKKIYPKASNPLWSP